MARTLAPRPRWFERFLRPYWADEATRGTYLRNTILFAFVVFMLSMVYSAIADNLLEQILGTRSPIPAQVVLFVPATIAAIVFVAWRQAKIR